MKVSVFRLKQQTNGNIVRRTFWLVLLRTALVRRFEGEDIFVCER